MPSRVSSVSSVFIACVAAAAAVTALALGGCAEEPAQPLPFKPVPAERILKPGYTQPGEGLVAVDVRRERTRNVIVKLRDAPVYIDGEPVTDLMDGEHVTFYLKPGVHRIGVTTQFDPVVELRFVVDPRYTNRASVTFDKDHRIGIRRVAQ
ncbi:conserved exported hypothetical protein [Paraburkholderia unamae]|uniref:hypothetical protein n=1 Tax=Paraburkholderia unamae TaxID=219649 RepID=UPI001CAF6882|nr:hypothetical protein [Paraburkholderia unamae]CAG9261098.1 conserved exported hypothetical protein [Paraburkholderia unamae]